MPSSWLRGLWARSRLVRARKMGDQEPLSGRGGGAGCNEISSEHVPSSPCALSGSRGDKSPRLCPQASLSRDTSPMGWRGARPQVPLAGQGWQRSALPVAVCCRCWRLGVSVGCVTPLCQQEETRRQAGTGSPRGLRAGLVEQLPWKGAQPSSRPLRREPGSPRLCPAAGEW